jgi:Ser/Thr protein kinase RdoA (MazF antagonist)
MDDQQTYLLNGLLARNFGLGRIVRFRQVPRGRQAQTFEVLTQQQHEYTVYLYPPAYPSERLNFAARTINMLDRSRFSVVPMLPAQQGAEVFTAEGPQGATMLVSLTTTGSAMAPEQYTEHDISQVGLRLGWLHRLLKEQLPAPAGEAALAERLSEELDDLTPDALRYLPSLPQGSRDCWRRRRRRVGFTGTCRERRCCWMRIGRCVRWWILRCCITVRGWRM